MRFTCPTCTAKRYLTSKGIYNHVRLVLDSKDFYYLAREYMQCKCGGTFLAWDSRMLEQLTPSVRSWFPAVLTRKYACDRNVVTLFHARTLGNSPHALRNNILEVHSEEWLHKQLQYLGDCNHHRRGQQLTTTPQVEYRMSEPFQPMPTYRWFPAVYVRDVWSRLPSLLAAATSVYGSILKIDSTKKICRKLQDAAADTATWATNVGNEHGDEVLASVLTQSEGTEDLGPLAEGLMARYERAGL